jgi:hypothetical protein
MRQFWQKRKPRISFDPSLILQGTMLRFLQNVQTFEVQCSGVGTIAKECDKRRIKPLDTQGALPLELALIDSFDDKIHDPYAKTALSPKFIFMFRTKLVSDCCFFM